MFDILLMFDILARREQNDRLHALRSCLVTFSEVKSYEAGKSHLFFTLFTAKPLDYLEVTSDIGQLILVKHPFLSSVSLDCTLISGTSQTVKQYKLHRETVSVHYVTTLNFFCKWKQLHMDSQNLQWDGS